MQRQWWVKERQWQVKERQWKSSGRPRKGSGKGSGWCCCHLNGRDRGIVRPQLPDL